MPGVCILYHKACQACLQTTPDPLVLRQQLVSQPGSGQFTSFRLCLALPGRVVQMCKLAASQV